MTLQEQINALEAEILERKAYLSNTDYKVIKAKETNVDVDPDVLTQRQNARATINAHEEILEELRAQIDTANEAPVLLI